MHKLGSGNPHKPCRAGAGEPADEVADLPHRRTHDRGRQGGRLSVERRIGQRPSAGCEVVGDAGDVYMEGGLLD
jgi:hypothetical protein